MLVAELMRSAPNLIEVGPETELDLIMYRYDKINIDSRLTYVLGPDRVLLGVVTIYDILNRIMPPEAIAPFVDKGAADRDAFMELLRQRLARERTTTAGQLMRTKFQTVRPDALVAAANALIVEKQITAVPVVDEQGRLVGEITRRIILRFLAHHLL